MSEFVKFANVMHSEAMRINHRTSRRTPALVDSFDPETFAAKYKLMPDSVSDDTITGWIPLPTAQTGNQFGLFIAPNIGDPVFLEFHDDDREAATPSDYVFNDKLKPVGTVKAGEFYYKNKTKSSMYFDKDGKVTFTDQPTGSGDNATSDSIVMDGQNQVVTVSAPNSQSSNNYIKLDGKNKKYTLIIDDQSGDDESNELVIDGNEKTFTLSTKNGTKIVADSDGNVQVVPKDGETVFLGGTGSDGLYAYVMTEAGPSNCVKAKIG